MPETLPQPLLEQPSDIAVKSQELEESAGWIGMAYVNYISVGEESSKIGMAYVNYISGLRPYPTWRLVVDVASARVVAPVLVSEVCWSGMFLLRP